MREYMDSQSIIKHYDEYSKTYDAKNQQESQQEIDKLALQLIRSKAQGKVVLEVGCGTGIWMQFLLPVVKSIEGIDISLGMVKQAQKKGLNVKGGSAQAIPYNDNSFDFVFSYRVHPHVPNLPKALSEIKRVLRKDGKAIIMFYNKNRMKRIVLGHKMESKVYTKFYTIRDIQQLDPSISFLVGTKIFPYPKLLAKHALLKKVYFTLERIAAKTIFGRVGGNILVEVRK